MNRTIHSPARNNLCRQWGLILALLLVLAATVLAERALRPTPGYLLWQDGPGITRRHLDKMLYEVVHSTSRNALYVASANGKGRVLELDPTTLETRRSYPLLRKAYALALDDTRGLLYIGNTRESSITVLDLDSGTIKGIVQFDETTPDGVPMHTRLLELSEDGGTLYVTGVDAESLIWVVDTQTLALRNTIRNAGSGVGMLVDEAGGRIFTAGNGDVRVVDIKTEKVSLFYPVASPTNASALTGSANKKAKPRYMLNLALDAATDRLFITDSTHGELVVMAASSGEVLQAIPVGQGTLGVRFNPMRQEVLVANRTSGDLVVLDAVDYRERCRLPLPVFPNTIALDKTGQTAWLSLKQTPEREHPQHHPEEIEAVVAVDLISGCHFSLQ